MSAAARQQSRATGAMWTVDSRGHGQCMCATARICYLMHYIIRCSSLFATTHSGDQNANVLTVQGACGVRAAASEWLLHLQHGRRGEYRM